MPILICHSTTGWIPLKLSYRTLAAAISNINEIYFFKRFLFSSLRITTDSLLWDILYKAALCSPLQY